MTIDLIVSTYKPDKIYLELIDKMLGQTVTINKVIVMNVEQKFYDRLMYSSKLSDIYKGLEVHHIAKRESDLGKNRNVGVSYSDADYVLMMNQDAVPAGAEVVEKLLKVLESDEKIAVAYARQVVPESMPEYFKYEMRYYYPEDSSVRSSKDLETMRWGAYVNSNVCALYRRKTFDELGGFLNHVIANEDILYGYKVISEGYKIAYVADAVVVNHKFYETDEWEKAAFDKAVSFAKHPEVFGVNEMKDEFKKLEKMISNHLKRNGYRSDYLTFRRISRLEKRGLARGLKYKKLASIDFPKYSLCPEYWRMDEILRDRSAVDVRSGYGRSAAELEMMQKPPVRQHKFDE